MRACLIVIDGWGMSEDNEQSAHLSLPNNKIVVDATNKQASTLCSNRNGSSLRSNAILAARTPNMDKLMREQLWARLTAHGSAVGLPDNLMGNSEVGHLNIGAGRIVYQDIVRIDQLIESDQLNRDLVWNGALHQAISGNGRLHFIGLVSDGGVHSHIRHLTALLKSAKKHGISQLFIHAITDGRDTIPAICEQYLQQVIDGGIGQLATVMGRYYAMDRDKRWERTKVATDALYHGIGEPVTLDDLFKVILERRATGETDEFLRPLILNNDGRIKTGDTIVMFNYRSDRMRQICQILANSITRDAIDWADKDEDANKPQIFEEHPYQLGSEPPNPSPNNLYIITMTQYQPTFPFPVISPPQLMNNVLAEHLSKLNLKQCHVAETEKIAHVTFFFNGGQNTKYQGEEHVLIASPKVATYDLAPEMSVKEVGEAMIEAINHVEYDIDTESDDPNSFAVIPQPKYKFDFIMGNLAPPDMVGHTGKFEATVRAVEATDQVIGSIWKACREHKVTLFVTADHGNAECMVDLLSGGPHTAHTCAPVPFIVAFPDSEQAGNKLNKKILIQNGSLCDVAPTILTAMELPIPLEMTGKSLFSTKELNPNDFQ